MGPGAFLFDLDGVLVETRDLVIAGWRRVAAARGRTFDDDAIVELMFGRRTYDVLVEVFDLSSDEAAALVADGLDDKRTEVAAGTPLREIPGAAAFVRSALADGIACAVASSASRINVGLALDSIGLSGVFEVIVDGGGVARGKPAADPYLVAARGLGVDPRHCVVFEDTAAGIDAGLAAGARCVGVATLGRPELLERADMSIPDFRDQRPQDILRELAARRP